MKLSAHWLSTEMFEALKLNKDAHFYVALSGGLDSMVLIALMAELRQQLKQQPEHQLSQDPESQSNHGFSLTALHANHNLQRDSLVWEEHCKTYCDYLGVEFRSTTLELENSSELAARNARYSWFSEQVKYGDVLLTAHHQQDRAETLLFNLMRGAGSTGLSSLRAVRPFHGAKLARPLLNATQDDIKQYASHKKIKWVEDPSNQNDDYARNDIRHNVIPQLLKHRSDAVHNIARAAANLEQENGLLREIAISDLVEVREQPIHPVDGSYALCVDDISHLSSARQGNLLRFWLQSLDLHTPSRRFLNQLLAAIIEPPTSTAILQEGGKQFRFFRGFMYVMPSQVDVPTLGVVDWRNVAQPLDIFQSKWRLDATNKLRELAAANGAQVRLVERSHLNSPKALQGHTLNIKKWMQEMAVPPWRRQALPLLTVKRQREEILLSAVDQQLQNDWVSLQTA